MNTRQKQQYNEFWSKVSKEVSPENPRETQIMLYEDKFSDLFEMYLDHIKF